MAEMYYRKQWVKAFQFWPQNAVGGDCRPILHVDGLHSYFVKTAAGEEEIVPGDWIVCELDGVIRIVSPDEFTGNYERPVEPARKKFEALFEPAEGEGEGVPVLTTLEAIADPGYERLAAAVERLTEEIAGLRADNRMWSSAEIEVSDSFGRVEKHSLWLPELAKIGLER